jgi:hypothetical protein
MVEKRLMVGNTRGAVKEVRRSCGLVGLVAPRLLNFLNGLKR